MSIAQALSDLFGSVPQSQVAERLVECGLTVDQTKVSRWLRGQTVPKLDDIAVMEEAYGMPRGWVLARAGYVGSDPLPEPVPTISRTGLPQWGVELRDRVTDLAASTSALADQVAALEARLDAQDAARRKARR